MQVCMSCVDIRVKHHLVACCVKIRPLVVDLEKICNLWRCRWWLSPQSCPCVQYGCVIRIYICDVFLVCALELATRLGPG